MTWPPYTGADLLQGPLRESAAGSTPTPLSGGTKLPYRGLHLRGPDAHAERLLLVRRGVRRGDILLATSAPAIEFTISDAGTHRLGDYTRPRRCLPLDPCARRGGHADPQLEFGAERRLVRSHGRQRRGLHATRSGNTGRRTRVLTPRESYVDSQSGQGFFWFVRPCVDVHRVPVRTRPDERPRQRQRLGVQEDLRRPSSSSTPG